MQLKQHDSEYFCTCVRPYIVALLCFTRSGLTACQHIYKQRPRSKIREANNREKSPTAFAPVPPVKQMVAQGFAQLAITSCANDWFINPDTARIEAILEKLTPHYKAVHMLGFSMGGYGAFRFARATNATYVTAISPQF